MFGEHPEAGAERRYDFGCSWYNDHGPFYPGLQFAWFGIGIPCIIASLLALLSLCGFVCWAGYARTPQVADPYVHGSSAHYGPLISCVGVPQLDVDNNVHRWVNRGAYGAILYGVLLFVLAVFMALHANNEAEFSFLVDSLAALFMFASKLAVAICARTVHKYLSLTSQQVAKHWIFVLALSKVLTAVCALALSVIYLILAILGVDANRGDGTRRRLQDHGPTQDEQAELCAVGFFMMWSFLFTLISQSLAGFALASIYANAVRFFGDRQIFHKVVSFWWAILVGCTCGVGMALWLGAAICMFPALDISPLRMMAFFYSGAAVNQILAGSAMLRGNEHIRSYWVRQNAVPKQGQQVALGETGVVVGQPVEQPVVGAKKDHD